jgi:drug/metabolite transporter (DMT)-like permease
MASKEALVLWKIMVSALFVFATAVANVLQKKAVASLGVAPVPGLATLGRLLQSPLLWGALGAYAVSLCMYLLLLARLPLNVATSIAALNFIAVLLAARWVLGEPIPPLRYAGFAFILLGIAIVAATQRSST